MGCRTPGGRNGQEAGEGGRWEMETFKVNLTPILISLSTSRHLDLQPFPIQIILRVAFDRPVLMKAHLIVRTKHPFKHTPELLYNGGGWVGRMAGLLGKPQIVLSPICVALSGPWLHVLAYLGRCVHCLCTITLSHHKSGEGLAGV